VEDMDFPTVFLNTGDLVSMNVTRVSSVTSASSEKKANHRFQISVNVNATRNQETPGYNEADEMAALLHQQVRVPPVTLVLLVSNLVDYLLDNFVDKLLRDAGDVLLCVIVFIFCVVETRHHFLNGNIDNFVLDLR